MTFSMKVISACRIGLYRESLSVAEVVGWRGHFLLSDENETLSTSLISRGSSAACVCMHYQSHKNCDEV